MHFEGEPSNLMTVNFPAIRYQLLEQNNELSELLFIEYQTHESYTYNQVIYELAISVIVLFRIQYAIESRLPVPEVKKRKTDVYIHSASIKLLLVKI